MAPLPQLRLQTIDAIEESREAEQKRRHGYRLPPSKLGTDCERSLWYGFRWVSPVEEFSGQLLRLFETGNSQEERMIADLRRIGCDVLDCDPDDDTKQIAISFAYGHAYGYLDCEVLGLPDAPVTVHVGEMKSHNDRSFKHLVAYGVEKSKPEHYAQTLIYMHKRNRERGLYMAVNKNTDELYGERIEYDFDKAVRLERKAERIVMASQPPTGISDKPEFFGCKFCDHSDVCHGGAMPERNCRTCAHITPIDGGKWVCDFKNEERDREQQESGCGDHLYLPTIVPGDQVDVDVEGGRITYAMPDGRTWHNRRESMGGSYYA